MKKLALGFLVVLSVAPAFAAQAKTIEIPFKTHDGYDMLGKLTVPAGEGPFPIVVYLQTAEGMTMDAKRPGGKNGTFNYFDLYRDQLPPLNVAFFSYEGRGIRMGDSPPRFEKIDWDVYNTSTLENKVRDAVSAVRAVRKHKQIDRSKIILMGASEGTLLAAETAARIPSEIAGLVLYGVMAENMRETFRFIVSDGGFLSYLGYFDKDRDGRISKAEYDADPAGYKAQVFMNAGFEKFDFDGDGFFTTADMRRLSKRWLDAIDGSDYKALDAWAKSSAGLSTPVNWFRDHFAHPTIWTFLSRIDVPVGLFQGDKDSATSYEGVKKLEEQAKAAGKTNLEFQYFKNLDHTLNIPVYFYRGVIPPGHKAIFEYIAKITK